MTLSETQPFEPPNDPVFIYLISEALRGTFPVYGVVMHPKRLVRYAEYFRPEQTEEGSRIVRAIIRRWNDGSPSQPWIYPREDVFVVSDDYFTLAAIELGKPESIAAQCIGRPSGDGVIDAQGPLPTAVVAKMLGIVSK